jgi:hypothetical protein
VTASGNAQPGRVSGARGKDALIFDKRNPAFFFILSFTEQIGKDKSTKLPIMGTFITDRLQHLNNDLVQLFHLDTQALLDDTTHESAALSSSAPSLDKQGHPQRAVSGQSDIALRDGLRTSIDILDLRSGVVPSMERVLLEIEKIEALLDNSSPSLTSGSPQDESEATRLQHLFVAKCTISVYLNLLDIILNATLPLATEIDYWQSLLDKRSWRLLYILQSKKNYQSVVSGSYSFWK